MHPKLVFPLYLASLIACVILALGRATLWLLITLWVFSAVGYCILMRRPGEALESEDGSESDSRRTPPTGTLSSATGGGEGRGEEDSLRSHPGIL